MRASQQSAMLRGQQSQRSKATQLSPLNGVVADIPTRVGEFAVAGLSTTPLMTIADMSQINVEVNVDETEINNVKVGQEAKVKVDALGDKEIKAVVTQKNPLAISKSDQTGGLSKPRERAGSERVQGHTRAQRLAGRCPELTASRHELDRDDHN
jgi:HlyD family secretion protein